MKGMLPHDGKKGGARKRTERARKFSERASKYSICARKFGERARKKVERARIQNHPASRPDGFFT
ncbi:hypothetical protein [Fictibacillus sp. KU28468]|uniref:hypothetical protein n=1 Tax=Fictibacillus sp. KU28468 TaxID=2991053 RepID=UPI00223D0447|nr:hypothetical protein [Fictibacillus sp. KU28468]UZJ79459.1 hypothetical protein OKX00_02940 [Fictibacillus sp. KU28468]